MVTIELPYPPSMNHYWRHVGPRTLISRGGREFRQAVQTLLQRAGVRPLAGPLVVYLFLHPPDRRRRDIDNAQKPLLDALEHGGAYFNDHQVAKLVTERCEPVAGGKTVVQIEPFSQQQE